MQNYRNYYKKTKTNEKLLKVRGFGAVKVEKYGEEIVRILKGQI